MGIGTTMRGQEQSWMRSASWILQPTERSQSRAFDQGKLGRLLPWLGTEYWLNCALAKLTPYPEFVSCRASGMREVSTRNP